MRDIEDLFQRPARLYSLERSYGLGATTAAFGVALALTALPWSLHRWFPQEALPRVARVIGASPAPPEVWLLALMMLPTGLVARSALTVRRAQAFAAAYVAQSAAQFLWLLTLGWYCGPYFPLVGIGLTFGMTLGWAFNDAQFFHDGKLARAQYLLGFALFDLGLLCADALTGRGILAVLRADRAYGVSLLVNQLVLLGLSQTVLLVFGRLAREREQEHERLASLRVEHERLASQHLLLRRLAGFLAGGVSAGQLSHDLASPLTVFEANTMMLRELLGPGLDPDAGELLDELEAAARQVQRLTTTAVATIRSGGDRAPRAVSALLEESVTLARGQMREHRGRQLEVRVAVAEAEVLVNPLYAQAIANLLVNALVNQPDDTPIEVRGERAEGTYALSLRDHGVAEDLRAERLQRITESLSLSVATDVRRDRASDYRGFGMGLTLAHTLIVSGGGQLAFLAPAGGRGLIARIELPCVDAATPA